MVYINNPTSELMRPIRPVTGDGREFKTVREFDQYLEATGKVIDDRFENKGTGKCGVKRYRWDKATGKVVEIK